LLLSVVSALQALLLLGLVFGGLYLLHLCFGHPLPWPDYRLGFAGEFGVMALLSMTGVAMGLLLSACVNSPDKANALLPYVLIPQMLLGGGFLPIRGKMFWLAAVGSPVYWAYRAARRGGNKFPESFPYFVDYRDA